MEPLKWTDLLAATNLIVAFVAVVVALAAPYIAWRLTRRSQREDDKRRTKLNVFGALMQNRHTPQSREAVAALNLIDVAFHDNKEVRRLWQEYFNMISHPTAAFLQSQVGVELVRQKLVELQTAMARDLAYSIDQFDIQRIYEPTWLREEEDLRIRDRQAKLAAFRQPIQSSTSTNIFQSDIAGFYSVQAMGQMGQSVPIVLYVNNGIVSGTDAVGCKYTARFELNDGMLNGVGTVDVPAGVQLVTGDMAPTPISVPITFALPYRLDGAISTIQVGDKQVGVSFQKLQGA
jgi:hypothetical protein